MQQPPRTSFKLHHLVCIVLIIAAAFALRSISLQQKSFWYDEGYTVAFAHNSLAQIISGAAQLELNTPLHYLLLKLWMLGAGQSEFSTRLLSVFAGVLTVVAVGQCATRRASQLLAMLFVALSAVCISLSQETRMYSLLVCFCTLAVAQGLYCLRANNPRSWLWWGIFNALAFSTHVLGAIVFGAQVIALLVVFLTRRQMTRAKNFFTVAAFTGLGMLAVLAGLVSASKSYGTTYTDPLNYVVTLLGALASLVLPRLLPTDWQTATTFGVAMLLLFTLTQSRSRLVGSVTLVSVLGIAALCAVTGKFAARYIAIVAPLFLVAVADSLVGRSHITLPQLVRGALVVGVATGLALGTGQWRINPIYANENFRDAAQFIRTNVQDDEAVLLVSGHFAPVFAYYFGETGWHALPNDPVLNIHNALDFGSTTSTLNTTLRGKRGAWLLQWQSDVIDPTHLTEALLHRQANRLQPEPNTPQFVGLRLQHFRFNQPYQALPAVLPALNSKLEALGQSRGLLGSGCTQFRKPRTGNALMEIFCFWQIEQKNNLPYDLKISLRLFDIAGQMLAQSDQLLAPNGVPSNRYDKVMTAIYFMPLPPNLQAGSYRLQAIPYTPEGEVSPRATTDVAIDP